MNLRRIGESLKPSPANSLFSRQPRTPRGLDETELATLDNNSLGQSPSSDLKESHGLAPRATSTEEDGLLNDSTEGKEAEPTKREAWIDGVYICAKATAILLLINILLVSIAAGLSRKYPENSGLPNWAVMYSGSCTLSDRWEMVIHLIINLLSTGILAASNNCMQTLVAPTREDIDKYHARRRWLNIGKGGIRNLFAIKRYRLALWTVLMVTTTPFHLLYNSVIIRSLSSTQYEVIVGPRDLSAYNIQNLHTPALEKCLAAVPYNKAAAIHWDELVHDIATHNYKRLSPQKCAGLIKSPSNLATKAIVALAQNLTVGDGGDKAVLWSGLAFSAPVDNVILDYAEYYGWQNYTVFASPFSKQNHNPHRSSITCNPSIDLQGEGAKLYTFQECLVIPAKEHCQLLYSPPLCIIVIFSIVVKMIAMFLAARVDRSLSAPLLNIGDAVASFIRRPDPTTTKICWMSSTDVRRGQWKRPSIFFGIDEGPAEVVSRQKTIYKRLSRAKRWMKAPSLISWIAALILSSACIGLGFYYGIGYIIDDLATGGGHTATLLSAGQTFNSFIITDADWDALGSVVVANTPQLAITVSYYFYNNVLTSMLAAAEYSSYGESPKPLRVTWPAKGSQQRSTYWLSIPYSYSIPLLLIYSTVHWMVSQGISFFRFISYDVHGQTSKSDEVNQLAMSEIPLFVSACLGLIMTCALVGLSFRQFKSCMPLAGACSAAISAACHPPQNEDLESAVQGQVMWGETEESPAWQVNEVDEMENQKGHCSFTSTETVLPDLSKAYA